MGSAKEVRYWLRHYADANEVAVVKVSGAVLTDEKQVEMLCDSLAFIKRMGLSPIVVHGGALLLDAALEEEGLADEIRYLLVFPFMPESELNLFLPCPCSGSEMEYALRLRGCWKQRIGFFSTQIHNYVMH